MIEDAEHAQQPPGGSHNRRDSWRLFDALAPRYDRVTGVISGGHMRVWRRRMARRVEHGPHDAVLDAACGTADQMLALLRIGIRPARLVGLDPSPAMLAEGRRKLAAANPSGPVDLVEGRAETMPFEDGTFDVVTIAFGLRNIGQRDEALAEFLRVLQPGGRLLVLETTAPRSGFMRIVYRFYFRLVLPLLGPLLGGDRDVYRYFAESVDDFPPPGAFAAQIQAAGFQDVRVRRMTLGICLLFEAHR